MMKRCTSFIWGGHMYSFGDLNTFCSAKAAMEKATKVTKDKKAERKLEPLTDKTVYLEDLNSAPHTKKK